MKWDFGLFSEEHLLNNGAIHSISEESKNKASAFKKLAVKNLNQWK